MNRTLSAIKLDPHAVVLNLIDAMHMTSLFICIASMRFNTTALGHSFIADNVRFTVYESNFARSVKTAVQTVVCMGNKCGGYHGFIQSHASLHGLWGIPQEIDFCNFNPSESDFEACKAV